MWQSVPCHQSDDTLKVVTAIRVEGIRQDCKQRGPPMRIQQGCIKKKDANQALFVSRHALDFFSLFSLHKSVIFVVMTCPCILFFDIDGGCSSFALVLCFISSTCAVLSYPVTASCGGSLLFRPLIGPFW